MAEIRVITEADSEAAFVIVDPLNWGYFRYDIERLIGFDPQGNFMAFENDSLAGILFTSFFEDYAFMGPLIVREEFRKKKIGENLMSAGIEHLQKRGVKTIELDSVFPAATLYRRLGFKDKYFSYRFKKESAVGEGSVDKFDISMTGELIEFDRVMTGLNRENHLRRFCREFCDSIFIIKNVSLKGYGIARERRGETHSIGPLIATDSIIAEKLLIGILNKYQGRTLNMGVLEPQREFIAFLRGLGFIHTGPALRMYLGHQRNYDNNIYGIIAAEKG